MLLRQGLVLEYDSIIKDPLVVFLHIEKTAGVSIRHMLLNLYGEDNVLDELYMDTRLLRRYDFRKKRALYGHFHVNSYLYDLISVPFVHFTVLRDPVERVLSAYYFFKEHPEHILLNRLANKYSLEELLEQRHVDFHCIFNWMCFFLSGINYNDSPALLESAKHTLSQDMTFFGFVDRLDELIAIGQNLLGWTKVEIPMMNTTFHKEKPSEELVEIIKKHNVYDVQLYEFAQNLYKERKPLWLWDKVSYKR